MSKNIIVYEKDNNCLELFGELLNQHGFNAIPISDIHHLFDFVENNPTDVIISDAEILFSISDVLVNRLKRILSKIPTLYLSDIHHSTHLKEKMKIRHDRVIEKPVAFVILLESVYRELNT